MNRQITKEEAVRIAESGLWLDWTMRQRAEFQMMQKITCMPFHVFHEAISETLGRPVFTHEFGLNWEGLKNELFNGAPAPSFDEIINLIAEGKRVLIFAPDQKNAEQ